MSDEIQVCSVPLLSQQSEFYLIGVTSYLWEIGKTLRVRFLDGDPIVHAKVESIAHQWSQFANIKFQVSNDSDAEIRISFTRPGSWSMLGTGALQVSSNEPTMNFGWLKPDSSDEEYSRVVLHEFGHALGFTHEHQHPASGIKWDRNAVIDYYRRINGWDEQETERNVLQAGSKDETQYLTFDPSSIMLYPIPSKLTTDGFSTSWNTQLSATDKNFAQILYPWSPRATGYAEFHRRLDELWMRTPPVDAPALQELKFPRGTIANQLQDISGRSIEAKWIGYIIHHVVGNPPDDTGYKEFHRRLNEVWRTTPPSGKPAIEELQFPRGTIANQLQDISGRSIEAKWIGYIIHHVVGNPPDDTGYKEFHRRLNEVWRTTPPSGKPAIEELQFPRGTIADQLKAIPGRSIEAKWIGYIIHHIVGNVPTLK